MASNLQVGIKIWFRIFKLLEIQTSKSSFRPPMRAILRQSPIFSSRKRPIRRPSVSLWNHFEIQVSGLKTSVCWITAFDLCKIFFLKRTRFKAKFGSPFDAPGSPPLIQKVSDRNSDSVRLKPSLITARISGRNFLFRVFLDLLCLYVTDNDNGII